MRTLALAIAVCAGCAPTLLWTGRTADRQHCVEIVQGSGVQWVVVDGQRRAAYRGIAAWSLATGDGARVVYAASRGASWIVVDRHAGPEFDGIGEIALGARDRLAYAAERDGAWQVIASGVAVPAAPRWTAVLAHTLRFSRDGGHLVYAAEDATGTHVVVDGAVGPAWTAVGQLAMNDSGTHVAYAGRRGRHVHAVIDGVVGPRFRDVTQLTVAARGARTAYVGVTDQNQHVVVDGAIRSALDARVRALQVSADGAHLAYLATSDGADRIVCDGAELAAALPRTIDAASLAFVAGSPCGLAYTIAEAGGMRVIRGGVPGAHYDEIGPLTISADGVHLGYPARLGAAWRVVIDGREHDGGRTAEAPVWSPDGLRTGYLTRRGAQAIAVVDGRSYPFDIALDGTLAFSRDGRTWSIIAGDLAHEQLYFAIDGVQRVPLPAAELYSAAAALQRNHPLFDPATPNVLGLWSAAEADRARSSRGPGSSGDASPKSSTCAATSR